MSKPKDYAGMDAERQFAQRSHRPTDDVLEKKEDLQIDHYSNYRLDQEATIINENVEDFEPVASDHQPQPIDERGIELPEEEHRIIHGDEGVLPVDERDEIKPGHDRQVPADEPLIREHDEPVPGQRDPIDPDHDRLHPEEDPVVVGEEYPTTNEEIISEEESHHLTNEPRNDYIDHGSVGNKKVLDNAQGTVVVDEPVVTKEDPRV